MELLYKYGNKNRTFAQGFFADLPVGDDNQKGTDRRLSTLLQNQKSFKI
jgi:hypothetical protein